MTTTRTTISARKIAFQGDAYTNQWVGVRAIHTTYEGERIEGTITHFDGHGYPVVTFDDGRWARGTLEVELVQN